MERRPALGVLVAVMFAFATGCSTTSPVEKQANSAPQPVVPDLIRLAELAGQIYVENRHSEPPPIHSSWAPKLPKDEPQLAVRPVSENVSTIKSKQHPLPWPAPCAQDFPDYVVGSAPVRSDFTNNIAAD